MITYQDENIELNIYTYLLNMLFNNDSKILKEFIFGKTNDDISERIYPIWHGIDEYTMSISSYGNNYMDNNFGTKLNDIIIKNNNIKNRIKTGVFLPNNGGGSNDYIIITGRKRKIIKKGALIM